MAKLSDRQKNNILAKWNTGSYSKVLLAKTYKVTEKTIRDIVGKRPPSNAHIVDAQVTLEHFKKSEKSTIEVQAINQAVKYELNSKEYKEKNIVNVHQNANELMEMVMKKARIGKAQKVITVGSGNGCSNSEVVDYDYQPEHYEKAINVVEKTAKVLGTIELSSQVQVNNSNNQQNNIVLEIE